MPYAIPGFDASWLLPFFGIQINLATGPNLAAGNFSVLCMGNRLSTGNLTLDSEIRQVFSRADINTAGGEGGEVSLMTLAALAAAPNVSLYMMAVTEAGGGAASTVTIVLGGAAASSGTYNLWIGGKLILTSYASGASLATIGAAIVTNVNAQKDCPFVASGTTTVTLTSRNVGIRTKDWIIYQDTANASGVTYAITGSASVNTAGTVTGVRAGVAGGTGADSIATAIASPNFLNKRWARIAIAQNDTTNAALLKAVLASQAGVTIQMYDQACYGFNGTQANTATLSQTTLNDPRENVFTCRNCETHPAVIAGGWAATRAAVEAVKYNPDYNNYNCSAWIAPQRFASDVWLSSEANALLNAGATPLTTVNGVVYCTRGVTTYCLNGATQDTRCLDIAMATVPDQFALALTNLYWTSFRKDNPYVVDNPDFANGAQNPPSGTGYPALWDMAKKSMMADWVRGGTQPFSGTIKDTFSGATPKYPVVSGFDPASNRIQGATTIVPIPPASTISEIINQAAV